MRNLVIYCLVFLFVLLCKQSDAQYYNKRFPLLGTTNGYINGMQIANDTVYTMSQIIDTASTKQVALFGMFDKAGNSLKQTIFDLPNHGIIGVNDGKLIRTNEGGFAYCAYTSGIGPRSLAYLLLKYDRNADLEWYKEIPDTTASDLVSFGLIQDQFSNYYFTGFMTHSISNDRDTYIAKTDSVGNLIYYKIFNNPNWMDGGGSLAIDTSGRILIGGGTYKWNLFDLSTAISYTKIYELDTNGNILKIVQGTDTNEAGADNILVTADQGLLATGSYYCLKGTNEIKGRCCIMKFDSNYHELWQINVGPCSTNTSLFKVIKCPDGNYLAIGAFYDEGNVTGKHINGWILKYSEQGQILWSTQYSGVSSNGFNGDFNEFTSCALFSDNSILCAGMAENEDVPFNRQQGWLLHLDTAGCLPDSNNCGIIDGVMESSQPRSYISVYPNPATDLLNVESHTGQPTRKAIQVVNLLGQSMYDGIILDGRTLTIDVKQWSAGIYSYRLLSEKGFISFGSFVVSHL